MDSKGLSETEHYGSFVDRTLAHVIAGLSTDGAAKKRKIAKDLSKSANAAPHERVRDARFALGADDASYLQSGLAMLWTTAGGGAGGENELALAPAGLYAPDAVGGVRAGLVRGLRQLNKDMHKSAPKRLQTLAPAILGLLATPHPGGTLVDAVNVPGFLEALNQVGDPKAINTNKAVLREGLAKLLGLVDGTSGKTLTNAVVKGIKSQVEQARDDARAKAKADYEKELTALKQEHAKKIAELNREKTELKFAFKALKSMYEARGKKIAEHAEAVRRKQDEIGALQAKIEDVTKEHERATKALEAAHQQALEAQRRDYEKRIAALEAAHAESIRREQEATARAEAARNAAQLAAADAAAQKDKADGEIAALKAQLAATGAEMASAAAECAKKTAELEAEKIEANEQVEEARRACAAKDTELSGEQSKLREFTAQTQKMEALLNEQQGLLQEELEKRTELEAKLSSKIDTLQKTLAEKGEETNELKAQIAALEEERASNAVEIEALKGSVAELKASDGKLQKELAAAEKARDEQRALVETGRGELEKAKGEVDRLRQELGASKQAAEEAMSAAVAECEQKLKAAEEAQNAEFDKASDSLKTEHAAELEKLKAQCEAEAAGLREELAAAQAKAAELEAASTSADNDEPYEPFVFEGARSGETSPASSNGSDSSSNGSDSSADIIAGLYKDIAIYEAALPKLKLQNDELQAEVDSCNNDLEPLRRRIVALETEREKDRVRHAAELEARETDARARLGVQAEELSNKYAADLKEMTEDIESMRARNEEQLSAQKAEFERQKRKLDKQLTKAKAQLEKTQNLLDRAIKDLQDKKGYSTAILKLDKDFKEYMDGRPDVFPTDTLMAAMQHAAWDELRAAQPNKNGGFGGLLSGSKGAKAAPKPDDDDDDMGVTDDIDGVDVKKAQPKAWPGARVVSADEDDEIALTDELKQSLLVQLNRPKKPNAAAVVDDDDEYAMPSEDLDEIKTIIRANRKKRGATAGDEDDAPITSEDLDGLEELVLRRKRGGARAASKDESDSEIGVEEAGNDDIVRAVANYRKLKRKTKAAQLATKDPTQEDGEGPIANETQDFSLVDAQGNDKIKVPARKGPGAASVKGVDEEEEPDWLQNAAVMLPDDWKPEEVDPEKLARWIENVKGPDDSEAAFVLYAQLRGLVGQRGPLDAEDPSVAHDAQLAYALPPKKTMAKAMPRARAIAALPETDAEARLVEEALSRVADDFDVATDGVAALAALEGNYAVTGATPASENDARGGVERPHAVRWLPRGEQGARLAIVAALEHAAARCAACAKDDASLPPAERAALRATAAALKLRQLPHLYAAVDAADRDPAGAKATRHVHDPDAPLVTTPCAVVRGTLSYPIEGAGQQVVVRPLSTLTPPEDADAIAKKGMADTKFATAQLRGDLKRTTGAVPTVYAVPTMEHAVVPGTILRASPATGAAFDEYGDFESDSVCDQLQASDYSLAMWRRILRRALVSVHAAAEGGSEHVDNLLKELQAEGGSHVEAQERRDGLWTQFHRHVAISHDRLWVFVRTLSGCLGGDINEIISMADEQTAKSTKALQEQRLTVAKRTAEAQSKIVETIVSGMVKESKLTFDKDGDDLVVVNSDTRKELRSLASGESGRPFFEANVAMRNLSENGDANMKLSTLLQNVAAVGEQIQRSLEKSLLSGAGASGTASVVELSHPSNCYFVSMKADAVAAIRSTHERLNVELGRRGRRRLHLWELIEGGCIPLSTRFAEAVGHVLVQARSSTGVSAMYVSQAAIQTNAIQGRIALERLATMAVLYAARVGAPSFEGGEEARRQTINAGTYVEDVNVGSAMRAAAYVPERNLLDAAIHPSGWSAVGFRRG